MTASFTPAHRGGSGSPMVCIHGITDSWRTWELVLPALERHHDVLAPTLAGHAGGPAIEGPADEALLDAVERAMDEAGFETAHLVGSSLGGYVALHLAMRGRARSVVALAPAGGWPSDHPAIADSFAHFTITHELVQQAAPHADAIAATPEGRRRATLYTSVNHEHIPAGLVAHQIRAAAACDGLPLLVEHAGRHGWEIDPERIGCPVRVVWGTADRLLKLPEAAVRYREWLPQAEWIELDGVGHLPQLDVPAETADLILGLTAR